MGGRRGRPGAMSRKPHIGLVAIGGKGWMGGANYVRNLAAAIEAAAPGTPVSWLCGEKIADEWRDVAPRWTMQAPSRVERWLGRHPGRFRHRLQQAGVDFVYPLTYDNTYNLSLPFPITPALRDCGWAGWIPIFSTGGCRTSSRRRNFGGGTKRCKSWLMKPPASC